MSRAISRMTRWLAAAAVALAASAASAQGVVGQTTSSGAVGALYGRDAAHAVTAYVAQTRSASGEAQTWLFFEIDEPYSGYPWGTTNVLFGSGLVPNSDLATDGLGRLVLATDLASNPSFTTYACPNPPNPEPPYCVPIASTGTVAMTLSHDPAAPVYQQSGQWTWDYGNVRIVQSGSGVFAAATGTGSVAGIPFPAGATGSIGASQNVAVVVEQGQ